MQSTIPRQENVAILVVQLPRRKPVQHTVHTSDFSDHLLQQCSEPDVIRVLVAQFQKRDEGVDLLQLQGFPKEAEAVAAEAKLQQPNTVFVGQVQFDQIDEGQL